MSYKTEVFRKIEDKPRLVPIFTSTHCIPERVYEYNSRLFLAYNCVTEYFEVHSLDQQESFCAQLPYKSLDARTIRWIWKNDVRVHGRDIIRRIEKSEQQREATQKREFHNWVEAVGKETRSQFAKDAWTVGT